MSRIIRQNVINVLMMLVMFGGMNAWSVDYSTINSVNYVDLFKFKIFGEDKVTVINTADISETSGYFGSDGNVTTSNGASIINGSVLIQGNLTANTTSFSSGKVMVNGTISSQEAGSKIVFNDDVCASILDNHNKDENLNFNANVWYNQDNTSNETLPVGSVGDIGLIPDGCPSEFGTFQTDKLLTDIPVVDGWPKSSGQSFGTINSSNVYLDGIVAYKDGAVVSGVTGVENGNFYDYYLSGLAFQNNGTFSIEYIPGKYYRIFIDGQLTFANSTKMLVVDGSSNGSGGTAVGGNYKGSVLWYTNSSVDIPAGSVVVYGTLLTPNKVTVRQNTSWYGQVIAKELSIDNGFNGGAFVYVPFDPPEVSPEIVGSGTSVIQESSGAAATLTIKLADDREAVVDITFDYCITPLTASDADFTSFAAHKCPTTQTITIAEKTKFVTFSVPLNDDTINEGDETFKITFSNIEGAVFENDELTVDYVVTIIDDDTFVNSSPVISDFIFNIDENSPNSMVVGTVTATDVDSDPLIFTLSDTTSFPFAMDANGKITVTKGSALNYEGGTIAYTAKVSVSDGTSSVNATVTININNVNEAPKDITLSNTSILENSGSNFTVGTLSTTDVDASDSHTYTLVSNPGSAFKIVGNKLVTNQDFDFETKSSYPISIKTTDAGGLTITEVFTILITNENEVPVLTLSSVDVTFLEDGNVAITVGSSDPEGAALTLSATEVGSLNLIASSIFSADKKTLTITSNPDSNGVTTVKVTLSDGVNSFNSTIAITITPVNDVPSFTSGGDIWITENDLSLSGIIQWATNLSKGPANESSQTLNINDFQFVSGDESIFSSKPSIDSEGKIAYVLIKNMVDTLEYRFRLKDNGGTANSGVDATTWVTFKFGVANTNDAPTVVNLIPNQSTNEDALYSYTVPANTFADVDADDVLTLSATLSDGSALPSWLTFNVTTKKFSGTPLNEHVGLITIKVTAKDNVGEKVSDEFILTVLNTNDAPTVANLIPNQSTDEDALYSYTVPANTFADVDADDVLTLSATLSDGSALPSWLTFNTTTKKFTGTPLNANVGSITIKVTATDIAKASVSDSFKLTVVNANDAPIVANLIPDQSTNEDALYSYTVPANTFADVDEDDVLTLSATLSDGSSLPSWLTFNTTTNKFTGTPLNANVGSIIIKVTATDIAKASVSDSFKLTVVNTNDAPTVVNLIPDQSTNEDALYSYTVPANIFADDDIIYGDILTLSATLSDGSSLPSWLTFNTTTNKFTGTPLNANVGSITIKVTATDIAKASVSDSFKLTVVNANDAPIVANLIPDQFTNEDALYSYTVPANTFADVDAGGILTLSATLSDGSSLPSWLTFNATTNKFTGTPLNANVGSITIKVTAKDNEGASVSDEFKLTVVNTNDAPTVVNLIPDQSTNEDALYSYTVPTNTFADDDLIHGDVLTLSATLSDGSSLPSWLTFNATTKKFTGTPLNANVGSITIKVTATDIAGESVLDEFILTVVNTNDAPVVENYIYTVSEIDPIGTIIGEFIASDIDGDVLTYFIEANSFVKVENNQFVSTEVFDFETQDVHTYSISVNDGTVTVVAQLTINVIDVDEVPDIYVGPYDVPENSMVGTIVNRVDLVNQLICGEVTFVKVANKGDGVDVFDIDANTGDIIVAEGAVLDFEVKDYYEFYVVATNVTGTSEEQKVEIRITNVNEPPTIADQQFSLDENSLSGVVVGNVVSQDPENNQLYSLIDDASGRFAITSTGELTVVKGLIDFETEPTITLIVKVDDGEFNSQAQLTINLRDVNEAPVIIAEEFSVNENSPGGTIIDTIKVEDVDSDVFLYDIIVGTELAEVDENGVITIKDGADLDHESNPIVKITVTVSDGMLIDTLEFSININDVNEVPFVATSDFTIEENAAVGTDVGIVNVTDPDEGSIFTYSLLGEDLPFSIDNNGKIIVTDSEVLDFETNGLWTFTVEVEDNDGLKAQGEVVVRLSDINETSVVEIVEVSSDDSVWVKPDTIWTNDKTLDVNWIHDGFDEFDKEIIEKDGYYELIRGYKDPTKNNIGYDTVIVVVNTKKPIIIYPGVVPELPEVPGLVTETELVNGELSKDPEEIFAPEIIDGEEVFYVNDPDYKFPYKVIFIDGELKTVNSLVYKTSELKEVDSGKPIINQVIFEYTDDFGNIAFDTIRVILDTKPPIVEILTPEDSSTTEQYVVDVEWVVDDKVMDFYTKQSLSEGDNIVIRSFMDKAGNVAADTILVELIPKETRISVNMEDALVKINTEKINKLYDIDPPKENEKFVLSVINTAKGKEEKLAYGSNTETTDFDGVEYYSNVISGHIGPTFKIDITLPHFGGVDAAGEERGGTINSLLSSDNLIYLQESKSDGGQGITIDEYIENHCIDGAFDDYEGDINDAGLFKSVVFIDLFFFDNIAQYVDRIKSKTLIDNYNYLSDGGVVSMFLEMRPDINGYLKTSQGQSFGNGVYLVRGLVKSKSQALCDTKTDTKGDIILNKDKVNINFGYMRPEKLK